MLSFCLDLSFDHLTEKLNEVVTEHMDSVFRHPGELNSAEDHMTQWLAAIRDAAGR